MAHLTIIGLGPGAREQLTLEAQSALAETRELYLRTRKHPVVSSLAPTLKLHSFDHLYRRGNTFDQVYEAITSRVLDLARRPGGVVYAVPGHPLVGEESVRRILPLASSAGIPVRLVAGLSFLDPVFAALRVDPLAEGLQVADATAVATAFDRAPSENAEPADSARDPFPGSYRPVDPVRPVLLCQVYGVRLAGALKVVLLDLYPPEHPATVVQAAGVPDQEKVWTVPLFELDRQPGLDHLTTVYLPALEPLADVKSFETLRRVIARLRAPGGCPWDREQTHESLRRYLIEESYEVLEALDERDMAKLGEELGDLLLQVVLHAQLAIEEDVFTMDDVVEGITSKLIRRHPHVFGDVKVRDSSDVLRNWEQIKRAERASSGENASVLDSVPAALPALQRAQTVQKRVARTGFDWRDSRHAMAKVQEEVRELEDSATPAEQAAELGDLLFALVGVARHLDVDAEETLRTATLRFSRRFARLDQLRDERGLSFEALSPDEKLRLWQEAKAADAEA